MFKFRLGTHGLNKVGRHRGRNDGRQCKLCGEECESVVHVLLHGCPVYDTIRNTSMEKLDNYSLYIDAMQTLGINLAQ